MSSKSYPYETVKVRNELALCQSRVDYLLQVLDGKLERQNGVMTSFDVIRQVNETRKTLDNFVHNIESTLVALDQSSNWILSEEDNARIRAEQDSHDILKTFMPYMVLHQVVKNIKNVKETPNHG